MASGPAQVVVAPAAAEQPPGPPSERLLVETRHGRFSVTVHGEPGPRKTACVTFPDIALDAHACFGTLLHLSAQSARQSESLFSRLVFYHIDPPGHADGWDGDAEALPWLEMDQLAEAVIDIMDDRNLRRAFAWGVGAGANVLERAALLDPKRFPGLILVSASARAGGWGEWASWQHVQGAIQGLGLAPFVVDQLLGVFFSPESLDPRTDLVNQVAQVVAKKPAGAVRRYLWAFLRRDDITARLAALPTTQFLLFSGYASYTAPDSEALFAAAPNDRSSMITVREAGSLITEERPLEFIVPLQLFLQGQSIMIDVTRDLHLYDQAGPPKPFSS